MDNKKFDSFIIGQISKDINIDFDGKVVEELGGAVVQSGYAAANIGHRVGVLPKFNTKEIDAADVFTGANNLSVFPIHSKTNTSIKNQYFTADRERRTCTAISQIEPYT